MNCAGLASDRTNGFNTAPGQPVWNNPYDTVITPTDMTPSQATGFNSSILGPQVCIKVKTINHLPKASHPPFRPTCPAGTASRRGMHACATRGWGGRAPRRRSARCVSGRASAQINVGCSEATHTGPPFDFYVVSAKNATRGGKLAVSPPPDGFRGRAQVDWVGSCDAYCKFLYGLYPDPKTAPRTTTVRSLILPN